MNAMASAEKGNQTELTISDQAVGMLFLEDLNKQLLVPSSPGNLYVACLFDEDTKQGIG